MHAHVTDRLAARIQSRVAAMRREDHEAGMVSAEWGVATVAAAGCGGVLYKVVTSPSVQDIFRRVIIKAFGLAF